jgi:hypothetical protein
MEIEGVGCLMARTYLQGRTYTIKYSPPIRVHLRPSAVTQKKKKAKDLFFKWFVVYEP